MSKAFVDTTIVFESLGLSSSDRATKANAALANYSTTEAPLYGFREMRAGPLSHWILAHNFLVGSATIEEARERIARSGGFRPRQASVANGAIFSALQAGIADVVEKAKADPASAAAYDVKQEMENWICRKILKAWQKRRTTVTNVVQPLGCFLDSDLELDGDVIRVAGSPAGCIPKVSCGAAMELKKRVADVAVVLAALRPPSKGTAEKNESTRRRAALKSVVDRDAKDFPKKDCRAIGDAYFCVMAPSGSEILTSNISDFQPLTDALGKTLKRV